MLAPGVSIVEEKQSRWRARRLSRFTATTASSYFDGADQSGWGGHTAYGNVSKTVHREEG